VPFKYAVHKFEIIYATLPQKSSTEIIKISLLYCSYLIGMGNFFRHSEF